MQKDSLKLHYTTLLVVLCSAANTLMRRYLHYSTMTEMYRLCFVAVPLFLASTSLLTAGKCVLYMYIFMYACT